MKACAAHQCRVDCSTGAAFERLSPVPPIGGLSSIRIVAAGNDTVNGLF